MLIFVRSVISGTSSVINVAAENIVWADFISVRFSYVAFREHMECSLTSYMLPYALASY